MCQLSRLSAFRLELTRHASDAVDLFNVNEMQLSAIQLAQTLARERRVRIAHGKRAIGVQHGHLATEQDGLVGVVRRHDDGVPAFNQILACAHDANLVAEIKRTGRFVEQYDLGILNNRARHGNTLTLTSGKVRHSAIR